MIASVRCERDNLRALHAFQFFMIASWDENPYADAEQLNAFQFFMIASEVIEASRVVACASGRSWFGF